MPALKRKIGLCKKTGNLPGQCLARAVCTELCGKRCASSTSCQLNLKHILLTGGGTTQNERAAGIERGIWFESEINYHKQQYYVAIYCTK